LAYAFSYTAGQISPGSLECASQVEDDPLPNVGR
jgi:hypothetical protein